MSGYPSRLLHIQSLDKGALFVRLVDVDPLLSTYRWATLSHRWGTTGSPLCTTRRTIDQFKRSIPVSELPRTFADAIAITLAVGLDFIWIDSLCIVQDSTTDWEQESSMMGKIYESSDLTIAACSSMDSMGGCHLMLQQQPSMSIGSIVLDESEHCDLLSCPGMVRSKVANPFDVKVSPLSERGWVFQEVVLSRRILYCTRDQMYWQCRTIAESEDGTVRTRGQRNTTGRGGVLEPNAIPATNFPGLWWSWAVDYSGRDFTKHADRLYACAGISQFFSRLAGSNELVLGLMRQHLQLHLLWQL
ncbi:HET-domain-containing protein, partial [Lophiostoma macrostomum CBS 122681]